MRFVVLILLAALPSSAAASELVGKRLLRCQQGIVRTAARFLTLRREALDRCVAKAIRCPTVLSANAGDDPCLAAVATRCRRQLATLWSSEHRLEGAGPRCIAPRPAGMGVAPEDLLDTSGLGFETLSVFCPATTVDTADPADVSRCQRRALACAADAAVLSAVPRAAEVLARLGIALGPDAGCLRAALCGNGEDDGDEECDDGADNSDTEPDACRTDCTEARCGDGIVDSDEDCDDGNGVDGDGCDGDCSASEGACGNGVVESDEDCDDGNSVDDDGCDSDCTPSLPECGDGVRDDDEECDEGRLNSDRLPGRCRSDCSAPACDDGVIDVDRGEECEPPGTVLCSDECRLRLRPELPALAPGTASSGCQTALMRVAGRLFDRTRAATAACVAATARCVLDVEERDAEGTRTDRCLAAANRRCASVLAARSRLATRAVARLDAGCGAGVTLATLLDSASGLGFARIAADCPVAPDATPGVHDLLACVASTVQCRADEAVARSVPRAYELLWELDLDPDTDFPCVTDPEELAE